MSSPTAYAVYNTSYELRTPYVTVTEYSQSPTAMDTSNLIPGGSAQANATALVETIGRASSWIDSYCCGFSGTLASTVETENARVWGSYRNTLTVKTRFWPITEMRSLSYSPWPGGLVNNLSASVTPSNSIAIYPQEFEVCTTGVTSFSGPGLSGFGGFGSTNGIVKRQEYDIVYTYVAGWVNTTLSASVGAGAASVAPSVVTGIYPGTTLTIYDLPNDEMAVVAPSYVPGAAVVPLTSNLQFNHATTATVANMPPAIKQAAILATTAFIKQRGSGALIAADIGEVTRTQSGFAQNAGSDFQQAMTLLAPYKQNYVGW